MMIEHRVKVFRVHGPGDEKEMEITFGEERLHASGVFANVYSAKLYQPISLPIAIKKTWPSKGCTMIHSEVYYLTQLKHPNIITLLYHFTLTSPSSSTSSSSSPSPLPSPLPTLPSSSSSSSSAIATAAAATATSVNDDDDNHDICHCMIFDFLPTDLSRLRLQKRSRRLPLLDAKLYAFQLFSAIDYVNSFGIAHRDIKPSNLIVDDEKGILKLADFGSAKLLKDDEENTPYQVTRYYRAPELVFGSKRYSTAIDIWACGCVLAEFVTGKVLLQGRNWQDQARLVISTFGYPTNEQCQAMKIKKPRFARKRSRNLREILNGYKVPDDLIQLLQSILIYEPYLRIKGGEALKHSFFDDLRKSPAPVRSNGQVIPALDYDIAQQNTQESHSDDDGNDDSEDDDDSE